MNQAKPPLPPLYGLYGDLALPQDPGYVHIEDIAQRSRKLGWVIKPHRHTNLFQILHLAKGSMRLRLETETQNLSGPCSIVLPVGVIHGFEFQPNTEGKVLSVAADLLDSKQFSLWFEPLTRHAQVIDWASNNSQRVRFEAELELLQQDLKETQLGFETAMEWQVGRVLLTLTRRAARSIEQHNKRQSPPSETAEKFQRLVEAHYSSHLSIKEYADQLHVSISSLHRHCVDRFSTTPKNLIQNRLIREAKRRLVYTQHPAEHIAYELGFQDPAYFTRYFKRNVGMTPSQYRQDFSRRF
jgi:AraC family transcriptional activator of pobA